MPDLIHTLLYPLFLTMYFSITIYFISIIKIKPRDLVLFTILNYFIFVFISYLNMSKEYYSIIILLSVIFIYTNSKNLIYTLISSLLNMLIIGFSDSIISLIAFNVFNLNYNEIINEKKIFYTLQVFILLLIIVIGKLLRNLIKTFNIDAFSLNVPKRNFNINFKNNILFESSFLSISLFLYLFIFSREISKKNYSNILYYCISFVLIFSIFLYLLIIFKKNLKAEYKYKYKDKLINQLQEYTKTLEKMSTDLRKFKHDYNNIITTIGEYIEEKDIDGLRDFYYNELILEGKEVLNKDQSLSSLKNIKEFALKSIISSKYNLAKSKNINIKIEILEDIPIIPMRIIELCRVIGIFLDNAIEASLLSEKKFINFAIINSQSSIVIIIENSCNDSVPPISKIYKENFSQKGENRGFGLSNALEIISKTRGRATLSTTCKNRIFTQELTIKKQTLL